MKYDEFRRITKDLPLINFRYLKLINNNEQVLKNQLLRWQKTGKIIRLRRGLYILNSDDRKINPSRMALSKEIYSPSYVSMEYALSFYGLIPEKVVDVTCITTKKTAVFENMLGKFIYQHLKTICFTGFYELKDETGLPYYIAVPEKAVVDFVYLNQECFKESYFQTLLESFRFQNINTLNANELIRYANLFTSKKMKNIIEELIKYA